MSGARQQRMWPADLVVVEALALLALGVGLPVEEERRALEMLRQVLPEANDRNPRIAPLIERARALIRARRTADRAGAKHDARIALSGWFRCELSDSFATLEKTRAGNGPR